MCNCIYVSVAAKTRLPAYKYNYSPPTLPHIGNVPNFHHFLCRSFVVFASLRSADLERDSVEVRVYYNYVCILA